jgi:hypothetical protein
MDQLANDLIQFMKKVEVYLGVVYFQDPLFIYFIIYFIVMVKLFIMLSSIHLLAKSLTKVIIPIIFHLLGVQIQ